jgi:Ca2+-binding RTX toxin-like protein
MSIRRLTVALALAAVSVGATASSAGAWTLSGTGGSLTATPTTEAVFFVSVTLGTDGNVHFAPAADTPPAGCTNSDGDTTCPTSAIATGLVLNDVLGAYVAGITTSTLRIVGAPSSDQWTLSNVTIGTLLDIDPGSGNDQLNATGSVAAMQLDNKATEGGSIALTLDTGPTTGRLDLGNSNNNYVYAPSSLLNLTGDGDLTAGGALTGGSGNATFHAISTSQQINGGGSHDAVTFARITTPLTLTLRGDNVLLNSDTTSHVLGVDDVTAGRGNDTLIGGPPPGGATTPLTLRGGPGNDLFVPMGGPENILGAPGDTKNTVSYSYLPSSTPLSVDLSAGLGGPTGTPSSQLDQLTNIQSVIGNDGTDNVTGSSQGGTFILGNGNNTVTGSPENDVIHAGSGTDNINGGGANDTIMGGSGNDTLIGGPGNNKIEAGSGTTVLEDSGGNNDLLGGSGHDTVSYANRSAGEGVLVTLNGSGVSTGNGQPGENDTITGIENIIGGAGDDTLNGDNDANVIRAGSGDATIKGANGGDTLIGGSGKDTIRAGKGVNTITTGNSDNVVTALRSAKGSSVTCGSGFNNVTVNPSVTTHHCQLVTDPDLGPYVPPAQLINTRLVRPVIKRLVRGFSYFKKLDIVSVPPQSDVSIACSALANVCPRTNPEALNFNSGRGRVHLRSFLKSVGYLLPARTTLTILVTGGSTTIGRRFVLTTRSSAQPHVTTACLKPRTTSQLETETLAPGGFSTGGAPKTIKCPAPSKPGTVTPSLRKRSPTRRTHRESQEQRRQAAAWFAAVSEEVRALVQRDVAALALALVR